MEPCCETSGEADRACPGCGRPGRSVERITVKAMLRPAALSRLDDAEHRFCTTSTCPVVYFGESATFKLDEIGVAVFQKEAPADRTVCYCFAITEGEIAEELGKSGASTAVGRITALVKADRCACEVKNPQGSCCLGNVGMVVRSAAAAIGSAVGVET